MASAVASTSTARTPVFSRASRVIQDGDVVINYAGRDSIQAITVTPGQEINSRYGHFRHADMIGLKYGTKMASKNGRGFTYLLRPTPELWTLALPHRTQILYLPDISFVISHLNIRPGSKVIEAGTGSGSFSHSVARSIGTEGKLYSFEFHEERYGKALNEFAGHGLSDVIELRHRNVCKDGFEPVKDEVDAVFLDLPAPWEAIASAKDAMRTDRISRICCFSPCIEQVTRTTTALRQHGFTEIVMYETLHRTYDPNTVQSPSIQEAIARLTVGERRKEERRERQIELSEEAKAAAKVSGAATDSVVGEGEGAGEAVSGEEPPSKKVKLENGTADKAKENGTNTGTGSGSGKEGLAPDGWPEGITREE